MNEGEPSRIIYPERNYSKVKVKLMSDAVLQSLLNQIYRETHNVVGSPLKDVILFGSYARGDYDEESDIDIALIIDLEREELRQFNDALAHMSSEMSLDNDVLISIISIPSSEFDYWKNALPFYRNVDTEGVRLSA